MTICVPLKCSSVTEVISKAKEAKRKGADLVEIWLDDLDEKDIKQFEKIPLPILCVDKTNPSSPPLIKAMESGVDYVDIDIASSIQLPDLNLTQLIISYHNFEETPDITTLKDIISNAKAKGADIIKIATQANKDEDNDTIFKALDLIQKEDLKGIALCMGPLGVRSRTENPNSLWTYIALDEDSRTADGQLTTSHIDEIVL